jgi:hypothetical protein
MVILKQFKGGASIVYLAGLYGFTKERIEKEVRLEMIKHESERFKESNAKGAE